MEPKTPLRASCMVKWRSEADDMAGSLGVYAYKVKSRGDEVGEVMRIRSRVIGAGK